MKKKSFHYSQSEVSLLNKVVESREKLTKDLLESISDKINRPVSSIQQYIYKQRGKLGYSTKSSNKISEGVGKFRQGEFVIPVKDWEVRSENGNTLLVLKFNKTA